MQLSGPRQTSETLCSQLSVLSLTQVATKGPESLLFVFLKNKVMMLGGCILSDVTVK